MDIQTGQTLGDFRQALEQIRQHGGRIVVQDVVVDGLVTAFSMVVVPAPRGPGPKFKPCVCEECGAAFSGTALSRFCRSTCRVKNWRRARGTEVGA